MTKVPGLEMIPIFRTNSIVKDVSFSLYSILSSLRSQ